MLSLLKITTSLLMFCEPCIVKHYCNKNQQDALFTFNLFDDYPLNVSSRFTAHHQEVLVCIYSNWYLPSVLCWLAASGSNPILLAASQDKRLQRVIEGKIQGGIEVTGRQGRRSTKVLDDFKERRGYSHLKEEALDRTMWRAGFGSGFGPVVRQTTK
jgi:hypothetical protein